MAIAYELSGGVAEIRFDRPAKLNALTLDMYEQLGQAWADARDDPAVRVVLLTGAGERAFCVGADLEESIPALASGRFDISRWDPAHLKGMAFYKPIVAAVNGLCLGGGFEILLATDIRIASSTRELRLPRADHGLRARGRHARAPAAADRLRPGDGAAADRRALHGGAPAARRRAQPGRRARARCWTWRANAPSAWPR